MNKKEFQRFIKGARKAQGMTLRDFADELGVNWVTVWRWEKGRNCPAKDAMGYWVEKVIGICETV